MSAEYDLYSDDSDEEKSGGWITTFADLMALLMCFFVLLLAFSEMDIQKFKQIAGSMKVAFGVQREVRAHEIPKGTRIIARQFSPGKPTPTKVKSIRQNSASVDDEFLNKGQKGNKATRADAKKIADSLHQEIKAGLVEVETVDKRIIIRILEQGSFASGRASMRKAFLPIMAKIRHSMRSVKGLIRVSEHTDDLPILTARFRSNWDLSSARAVSVVHELLVDKVLGPDRFAVMGFGAMQPRVPNDSASNRAKNRRVDIIIEQGNKANTKTASTAKEGAQSKFKKSTLKMPKLLKPKAKDSVVRQTSSTTQQNDVGSANQKSPSQEVLPSQP